ncbi:TPA: phage portal protein [Streptococcus suis]
MGLRGFFANLLNRNRQKSTELYLRRNQSYWRRNSIYLDNIYNKIATDVAMLRFKHVKITRNTDRVDDMEWLEHSDLSKVLNFEPNPTETPIVFWSNVVRSMLREGVAVVIPRYDKGLVSEIYLAQQVISWGGDSVTLGIESERITLPLGNVWVFENPKQNVTAQLNQITNLIDENLESLSRKISEQGSQMRGLMKFSTTAADSELRAKMETRVSNMLSVAENGGIGYLEKGEEFQELSNTYATASSDELEFLKQQLYNAYGINERLFTCDYSEEQYRAYFSSILKLYQRVIDEEINRKYFSKTARTQGHRLMVYYDMADITSLKDLSEFTFKAKYSGLMNSNELREIYFGLPGYDGGEKFETNKNAVTIGTGEPE